MKLLYVDVETTGRDRVKDYIFQIAGQVKIDGKVEKDFNYTMKPPGRFSFSQEAQDVTGKTVQDLLSYEDPVVVFQKFKSEVLDVYINKYDKTDKFHMVGYNVQFDMDFMREWFTRSGEQYFGSYFWFPPIDVMYLASMLLAGERSFLTNFQLKTVYEYVMKKPLENAHDAFTDIVATSDLFNELFRKLK